MGRPTIYTEELANTICARIASGESVRSIGRDDAMPNADTIYSWLREDDKRAFSEHYTQAMDTRTELLADETMELADVSVSDIHGDDKSDAARVQARKLQVDTRKWAISKMKPKKYGDKLDLTSGGEKLPTPLLQVMRKENDPS